MFCFVFALHLYYNFKFICFLIIRSFTFGESKVQDPNNSKDIMVMVLCGGKWDVFVMDVMAL